jgi:hypothetical protein
MLLPSRNQLRRLDEELADLGVAAFNRPHEAAMLWATRSGADFLSVLRENEWFEQKFSELHPSVDYTQKPFVTLCVSARSVSYFADPPIVLGTTAVSPIRAVKITEAELSRLHRRHPTDFWELHFQATDAIDLFLADMDFHSQIVRARNMLTTGMHQLGASARQLVAGEIDASLPQGMCLAVELIGKAVAIDAAQGHIDERSTFGHNLPCLFDHICNVLSGPNNTEVEMALRHIPRYEDVRYDAPTMAFRDAQNVYRAALFLCAEAMRRTRQDQLYWKLLEDDQMPKRVW